MTLAQSPELSPTSASSQDSSVKRRDVMITAILLALLMAIPPMYRFAGRVGLALLMLVLVVVWMLHRGLAKKPQQSSIVLPIWLILAGLAAPIALAASPRFALESAMVPLAAAGLLLFLSSGVVSREGLLVGVALAGGVMGLVTLLDFVLRTIDWIQVMSAAVPLAGLGDLIPVSPPRATVSPYLHPNESAPILVAALTASVATARLPGMRRLAWMTGLSAVVAVALTGSRGGMVAALFGAGLTWILLADGTKIQRQRRMRVLLGGLALGVLGLGGLWIAGVRPDFIFRSTYIDRLPVMRLGLEMAADSPWVGHGPGAFPYLFPLYGPELYPGFQARTVWIHAHNAYIQSLVEFGVIGTALILAGIAAIVVRAVKGVHRGDRLARPGMAAAVGTLAAFGLQSTFDSLYTRLATVGFLVAITAAGVVPKREAGRRASVWATHVIPMLLIPVLVLLTVGAHLDYLDGRTAVVNEEFERASSSFHRSVGSDRLPVYLQVLNYAQTEAGEQPIDAPEETIGPFLTGTVPLNLAKAAMDSADAATAISQLQEAYPLIRGDEAALVEYGFLSLELGAGDQASEAFTEAVAMNPWLSTSPFLDDLPEALRRSVLEAAFYKLPCWFGDEWILTGAITDIQLDFVGSECLAEEPARLMAMVETGKASDALATANAGLAATPDAVDLRRVAGVAALEIGQIDEARSHLAIGALLGDPYCSSLLQSTFASGEVPPSIEELVDRQSQGNSPVLLDRAPTPVYVMGAQVTMANAHREAFPSPLAAGQWESAYTALHREMIDRP